VLRATSVRLDRAVQPQYQSRAPSPLLTGSAPIGNVDAARTAPGGVQVAGWALDADTVAATAVHFYVDGVLARTGVADLERADVGNAFPGWGSGHGFDALLPMSDGVHTVCVYGIDVGPAASNSLLGC